MTGYRTERLNQAMIRASRSRRLLSASWISFAYTINSYSFRKLAETSVAMFDGPGTVGAGVAAAILGQSARLARRTDERVEKGHSGGGVRGHPSTRPGADRAQRLAPNHFQQRLGIPRTVQFNL